MKRVMAFILCILMLFMLGCKAEPKDEQPKATETPAPTATPEPQKPKLGLSLGVEGEYADALEKAFSAEADKLNEELIIKRAGGRVTQQATDIKSMMSTDMRIIFILPAAMDGLSYAIEECATLGIRTVALTAPINAEVDSLITPDYSEIGKKAARLAVEAAKDNGLNEGRVYLLEGAVDSFNMQWMHDGFSAEAEEQEDIDVIDTRHFAPEREAKLEGIDEASFENANILFCQSEAMARAALERGADKQIICVGGSSEALQNVKDKKYYACIFFGAEAAAAAAAELARAVLSDKEAKLDAYVGLGLAVASESSVEKYIETGKSYAEPAE